MSSHGRMFAGDLLTCPKCLGVLDSPKSLPCLHTFCLRCLQDYCRIYDEEEEYVPCPVCRQHFAMPQRGLHELPNNYVVQSLVEAAARKENDAAAAAAANKPADGGVPARGARAGTGQIVGNGTTSGAAAAGAPRSVARGTDRDRSASERCTTPQPRRGKSHRAMSLDGILDQEPLEEDAQQQSYCAKHANEPIKFYCIDCGENLCVACSAASKHRQHKRQEIARAAETFVRQIDAHGIPIASVIDDVRRTMTIVNEKAGRSFQKSRSTELAIRQAGEKMKLLVDKQVDALLGELKKEDAKVFAEAESCKGKLWQRLDELEKFNSEWTELKSSGKRSDITETGKVLDARAVKLLKTKVTVNFDVPDVQFVPGKADKLEVGHMRSTQRKLPRGWMHQITLD